MSKHRVTAFGEIGPCSTSNGAQFLTCFRDRLAARMTSWHRTEQETCRERRKLLLGYSHDAHSALLIRFVARVVCTLRVRFAIAMGAKHHTISSAMEHLLCRYSAPDLAALHPSCLLISHAFVRSRCCCGFIMTDPTT